MGVLALPVLLPAAGFTGAGIAAGSAAAGIQSAVYGGAATGVFRLRLHLGISISVKIIVSTNLKSSIFLVCFNLWEQRALVRLHRLQLEQLAPRRAQPMRRQRRKRENGNL